MLNPINKFDCLITHGATFHADDVFATALMKILNPEAVWIRTLDPDRYIETLINKDGIEKDRIIVYDIGGGEFDHHQLDTPVRENGIKYAAFGLLWKAFGDHEQYPYFDEDFIQQIDDHDNGGKECEINKIIRAFNHTEHEPTKFNFTEGQFFAFCDVVDNIAIPILTRLFTQYDEDNLTREALEQCEIKENCDGLKYIISPVPPRNNRYLYEKDIRIVIYPHQRGGYAVQFRSDKFGSMESSYYFPDMWNGKPEKDLPDGVTFVHKSGFLANCKDIETAEKMANYKRDILDKYLNYIIMDCLNEFGKFIFDECCNLPYRSSFVKTSSKTGNMYDISFGIDSVTIQIITDAKEEICEWIDNLTVEQHHPDEILLIASNGYIIIDKDGNTKFIL